MTIFLVFYDFYIVVSEPKAVGNRITLRAWLWRLRGIFVCRRAARPVLMRTPKLWRGPDWLYNCRQQQHLPARRCQAPKAKKDSRLPFYFLEGGEVLTQQRVRLRWRRKVGLMQPGL